MDRLAKFDRILCLEMAAREIVRAGKGDEGNLAPLPEWQQRILQRRMQAPIAIERNRRLLRLAGFAAGARNGEIGTRAIIEIAARRNDDIGGVVGAAQEDDEQLGAGLRRRPNSARERQPAKRGEGLQESAPV